MGLDLYMEAVRLVAPYDAQTEPIRRAIGTAHRLWAAERKAG